MIKPSNEEVEVFLAESNAIEGVYDYPSVSKAKRAWDFLMKCKKMTPDVVLETHWLLMEGKLDGPELGQFRTVPVYIGGHEAMNSASIPYAVEEWCAEMNEKTLAGTADKRMRDEVTSRRLHVDYERIHPFVDGNGRTGRMFMNWWRLKNNLPLLTIHEGEEQWAYYAWFK